MRGSALSSGKKLFAKDVADRILALLPEDGTPVLNRVMRLMLSREFQRAIEPDLYFAARNLLLERRQIGRLRGQGGQLFLESGSTSPQQSPSNAEEQWAEHKLMQPLRQYLEAVFRKGLDLPEEAAWIVHDTSSLGPQ